MASFNYVLITEENFQKLKVTGTRKKLKSGYYLLNQKDFSGLEGDTLWEKVAAYEGIIISESEAKQLLAGKITPPALPVKPEPEIENNEETDTVTQEGQNKRGTGRNSNRYKSPKNKGKDKGPEANDEREEETENEQKQEEEEV